MNDVEPALREVLSLDARHVAELLADGDGDRRSRSTARVALLRAYPFCEVAQSVEAEETVEPVASEPADLLLVLRQLEDARRSLGDDALATARRIAEVWVRTPFPQRIGRLRLASGLMALSAAVLARLEVSLALNDERITYFETRCGAIESNIGSRIRSPDRDAESRLLPNELELIRKRGRSRFS